MIPSTGPKHSVVWNQEPRWTPNFTPGDQSRPSSSSRRGLISHDSPASSVVSARRSLPLAGSVSGPTALPRSVEGPTRRDETASASWRRRRSERPAVPTRIASDAAEHFWPACPNAERTRSATARSTSADGVMTSAFLPEVSASTSSDGRQPANRRAVSIEPVSRTRETDGWVTRCWPTGPSGLSTTVSAPGASSPRWIAAIATCPHSGVCGAGLTITGLPAASDASTDPTGMATGKFHGGVTTEMPTGVCTAPCTSDRAAARVGVVPREVDGLADLRVGLGHGLAGLVDHRRDEVRAGLLQATPRPGAAPWTGRRATSRPSRGPRPRLARRPRRPPSTVETTTAPGGASISRPTIPRAHARAIAAAGSVSGVLANASDQVQRRAGARRRGAVGREEPVAVRRTERRLLGVHRGLVGEQGVQEVLARGVLLEPPHQVGDGDVEVVPRDDRRVEQDRADRVAHRAGLRGRHALQHLDVERLADPALLREQVCGRDVEQVVAGDADAQVPGALGRQRHGRRAAGRPRRRPALEVYGACGQPCSSDSTCSIARLAPLTSRTLRRASPVRPPATDVSSSSASDASGR